MNETIITEKERIRREKISKAGTGRVFSDITRKKISESRKGLVFSATHIENLRKSHLGKPSFWKKGEKPAGLVYNKPHTEETKKKLAQYTGEKASGWKGGTTLENRKLKGSKQYRLWREAVLKRDNYTCVWCGKNKINDPNTIINTDHIKPFAQFPELRFAIDNGRVLCRRCHETTDSYVKGFKIYKI